MYEYEFVYSPIKLVEKQKYAKWKAVDISTALKKGETPKPGNWKVEEVESEEIEEEDTTVDTPTTENTNNHASSSSFDQQNAATFTSQHNLTSSQNTSTPITPESTYVHPPPDTVPNFSFPVTTPTYTPPTPTYTPPTLIYSPQNAEPKKAPTVSIHSQPGQAHVPSDDEKVLAAKYAKFVVSSLDYDGILATYVCIANL
jgi:vacuolar protein sorting-associated protein VTA1